MLSVGIYFHSMVQSPELHITQLIQEMSVIDTDRIY